MPERRLDDDDDWVLHRGRVRASNAYQARAVHDPLVDRMLVLRKSAATDVRRQIDRIKYGARADRIRRLKLKPQMTEAEQAEVAEFDNQLELLYTHLPRPKTKGHGG